MKPDSHYATERQIGYVFFLENFLGLRHRFERGDRMLARSVVVGELVRLTGQAERWMNSKNPPGCPNCDGTHGSLKEMKLCYKERKNRDAENAAQPARLPG